MNGLFNGNNDVETVSLDSIDTTPIKTAGANVKNFITSGAKSTMRVAKEASIAKAKFAVGSNLINAFTNGICERGYLPAGVAAKLQESPRTRAMFNAIATQGLAVVLSGMRPRVKESLLPVVDTIISTATYASIDQLGDAIDPMPLLVEWFGKGNVEAVIAIVTDEAALANDQTI